MRCKQVNRQDAEKTITEYLKPIFGFALKRCKSIEDAEDLSQEIAMKAFRALLARDDITDTGKFIWTVAHKSLSNYYRDSSKAVIGVSIDDVIELIPDTASESEDDEYAHSIARVQSEIAYLSKLQRRIVIAYYFENRKQADIAKELDIPLGTVKWHLFEAKKELKRGMTKMREASTLKFNPIKFHSLGIDGSSGTKSPADILRSALSQNICYCVRNTAKTINEIADDLGVSPVYVENEIESLEEYGLLTLNGNKYLLNFMISEPTAELLTMQDGMYKKAAELFANDLYDELVASGILDASDIVCNQSDEHISLATSKRADNNFILWSLIPYIAASSGEKLIDEKIQFSEVATIRPDGGHNIVHAAVVDEQMVLPQDYAYMKNWCGPMCNWNNRLVLWRIDSEWSDRGNDSRFMFKEDSMRVLSLYERELDEPLSKDEYAWLAERGYVKICGDYDGRFKASWQVVVLSSRSIRDSLLDIGDRIKEKYKAEFDVLKKPYAEAVLESVPPHLRKIKEFELQYVFHSDGWFLLHCVKALLKNGKLKLPTEGQRKALTTLIIES